MLQKQSDSQKNLTGNTGDNPTANDGTNPGRTPDVDWEVQHGSAEQCFKSRLLQRRHITGLVKSLSTIRLFLFPFLFVSNRSEK